MSDNRHDRLPPKIDTPILDHATGRKSGNFMTEFTNGFLSWIWGELVVGGGLYLLNGMLNQTVLAWALCIFVLSAIIFWAIWTRIKYGWRGYIPGLLLGMGLTCLVPVGIFVVVCGPHF